MKRKLLYFFLLSCFGGMCLLGYVMTWQEAKENIVYEKKKEQDFPAPSFLEHVETEEERETTLMPIESARHELGDKEKEEVAFPVIGRIVIPGTPVDYPITQGFDTQDYLTTDITGEENRIGTLFILADNDVTNDQNIVIYGHNMGKNKKAMFSTLLSYKEPAYWESHRFIQLTVNGETEIFQVFAAFAYDTRDLGKWNFTQYNFASSESFRCFLAKAKELSPYSVNIQGDKIITLVTCDQSFDKIYGRYIVMGMGNDE